MFYQYKHFGTADYFTKEYNENFSFPAHLHNCFEFITVTSGEMTVTIDGRVYVLKSGESVLVFPNQLHSLDSKRSSHMLCIFSPDLVRAYYLKVAEKVPSDNAALVDKFILDSLDNILSDSSIVEKKGVLYTLCSIFDKRAKYIDRSQVHDNIIYKIFEFVEKNFAGECSLGDLSAQTGYSYSYLSRTFKKITGNSFNSYVNHYRITNSCYLLNNTDYTIIRCALESGYTSLRSFNRNFFSLMGVSPSKYREKK